MLNATALWQINCQREHNGKLHQLGMCQLRLADAPLPGSELAEAMKLTGIDGSIPKLHQGQTLITNCAAAGAVIGSLLERLANSTCEKSHGTK